MPNFRNTLYWVIGISIGAILTSLLVYYSNFKDAELSSKTQDWGAFGEYLNLIISLVNTIIIGYITYLLLDLQSAEYRPIVIFAVDPIKVRWYAHNVGKGAALNLVIARNGEGNVWNDAKKCYSLGPNEKFYIGWFQGAGRIIANYSDMFQNNTYTSICQGDETTITRYKANLGANHWIMILRNRAERIGP
ncbi:MAG TPA: hypothetical protein VD993_16920 [Chitinophagaceae bacterium]|nr:hypothetical protein [Chitinophagaceae bacterium]